MATVFKFSTMLCYAALLISSPVALASGSGSSSNSSNSMPSASTPQYDPAVEFKNGVEAMKQEKYKDAERAFDRVLSVNPKHAKTNFLAGLVRSAQDNFKGARRYYEKAIKYDDNMIPAHQELAIAHAKLGDADKARAILDTLKQRLAACADGCAQAADLQAAIPAIEAALSPTPAAPTSQIHASKDLLITSSQIGDRAYLDAVVLINEGRYQDAITQLNLSSQAFGPHPDILTYLGFANRKLGKFDVAEDYYRQALAAAPGHLGATEYYGELMVQRGDMAGAQRMLTKLETSCGFGCAQADELRRWIIAAKPKSS
ncbi:MAG: tetratricopeptide repeat protein [Arenimonas sp.]